MNSSTSSKSVESALQTFAMQELQEAVEEVNDFYQEKHGRVTAAAVKATEEKRVRLYKEGQDVRKKQALEIMLRQFMAEGDKRVSKRFFIQRYLAVKWEKLGRKGKGRARAPENCPEEDGHAGPGENRLFGRIGWTHSTPMNFPLEPLARAPHSDVTPFSSSSSSSPHTPPWTPASSPNSNPDSAPIRSRAKAPILHKPRLNPLANPFPDPTLAIQIQPAILLPQPLPLTVPAAHGVLNNTAPLPPTMHIATTQLQQRLRGVLLGPVRVVASQMAYDQQRQTQHQCMREYELQRAKGRI